MSDRGEKRDNKGREVFGLNELGVRRSFHLCQIEERREIIRGERFSA
jgi:hypothetical protein